MTKLYVGNLSEEVTEKDLRELFGSFGDVNEVAVFKDKGFAFVVSSIDYPLEMVLSHFIQSNYIMALFRLSTGHSNSVC